MSGDAIRAWRKQVTHEMLVQASLTVPEKRRPSIALLDHLGWVLACSLQPSKGYTDDTEQQIAAALHGAYTTSTVGDALYALRDLWVPIRRGAKGNGTRRVFVFCDPKGLLDDQSLGRGNPAEIATDKGGKTVPLQRENDLSGWGNPATPEYYLNTDPPAPAGAGLYSPDSDTQPTPPCRVCADATGDGTRCERLVRAVNVQRQNQKQTTLTKPQEDRLLIAARYLCAHYPDSDDLHHIAVLHQWLPICVELARTAHDSVLKLARQTPNPTTETP